MENIPPNQPVILAPNHQNALMDALVILNAIPQRTVFLARGDIFKNPKVAAILRFFRILPIFRIRDGYSELDKNEAIFQQSVETLQNGIPLCLMPEGKQSFARTLYPLVKGMFRIAFRAQEAMPGKEVFIIPVGIDYEDYINPFSALTVRFGKPISVKEYLPIYEENQAKGLNVIREDLWGKIDALIQNIQVEERYEEIFELSKIASSKEKDLVRNLEKRRRITHSLDEKIKNSPALANEIFAKQKEYIALLHHLKLEDTDFSSLNIGKAILKSVGLLLSLPLFLIGWIGNLIPLMALLPIVSKVKDISFKSSFSFVVGMVLFTLYYLILLLIMVFSCNWWAIIGVFSLPLSGHFSYCYAKKWLHNNRLDLRFFILKNKKKEKIENLARLRKELLSLLNA